MKKAPFIKLNSFYHKKNGNNIETLPIFLVWLLFTAEYATLIQGAVL